MQTTDFYRQVKAEFGVTDEQLDACQRWERGNGSKSVFYTVESATRPGTYYRVEYDAEQRRLRCLPHGGEPCKASLEGLTCWHLRAAVASDRIFRYELAQHRRQEAEAIEATPAYQDEQLARKFDGAEAVLLDEAAERELRAVLRDGRRAYTRKPFDLFR